MRKSCIYELDRSVAEEEWGELLRPVQRTARGLRRIRLHETELRILEENGRIYLILGGTEDFQKQTEVVIDLEDLVPRGLRRKSLEILRSISEFVTQESA